MQVSWDQDAGAGVMSHEEFEAAHWVVLDRRRRPAMRVTQSDDGFLLQVDRDELVLLVVALRYAVGVHAPPVTEVGHEKAIEMDDAMCDALGLRREVD